MLKHLERENKESRVFISVIAENYSHCYHISSRKSTLFLRSQNPDLELKKQAGRS